MAITSITQKGTTEDFGLQVARGQIPNHKHVYKFGQNAVVGDSVETICDTNSTGYVGVLTCDTTGYSGILKAMIYRAASPFNAFDSLIVEIRDTSFSGILGIFITLLLMILLPLTGSVDARLVVVFGVLAMIPAMALGAVSYTIVILLGCMAAIIIHIMTRTTGK